MPIVLPTEPLPVVHTNPKALLLYGAPKIGKTAILSKLPNCLIVDLEDGSDFVSCLKIKANSLDELTNIGVELKAKSYPYKYVAFDTIDMIEEWCDHHATLMYKCSLQGKSFSGRSVLELPNGGGYLWLRKSFHKFFDMCKTFAPYTIFVGHIRDKMIETNGKEVSAKDLDLTGKIKSIVCSYVDSVAHLSRVKRLNGNTGVEVLTMSFETKDTVVCGSRCAHLKGKSFEFTFPEALPSDWNQIYLPAKPETVLPTPYKV